MTEHANLAAALAAFQAELPSMAADKTGKIKGRTREGNPYEYSYNYADLSSVADAILPTLGKHGLSFSARPTVIDGGFALVYTLRHLGGESDAGVWPLPSPMQVGPQELGSAITYARRYALLAVTGCFPAGMDDDGKAAQDTASSRQQERTQQRQDRRQRQSQQPADQAKPADKTSTKTPRQYSDTEMLAFFSKLDSLKLDEAVALYDWMGRVNLHQRAANAGSGGGPTTATRVLAVSLSFRASDPAADVATLDKIRTIAEERGLLKTEVADGSTLDAELQAIRAIKMQEKTDTENARTLQEAAAQSFGDTPDGK